jgi:hypothetical protein
MSEPVHSGKVTISDFYLESLIRAATKKTVEDLGQLDRTPQSDYLVEAAKLSEFLDEFHDDDQAVIASEGGYSAAVRALTDAGYEARRSDWPATD